ncbi:MAG: hypothetical protein AB1546_12755, partial [bacterium]
PAQEGAACRTPTKFRNNDDHPLEETITQIESLNLGKSAVARDRFFPAYHTQGHGYTATCRRK